MKKILLIAIPLISLMLITNQVIFASEPPYCGPDGRKLLGPPVVGTVVIDMVGMSGGLYNYVATFTGCCADCFANCKASCNVRISFPLIPTTYPPEELPPALLENAAANGYGPKNCNPTFKGFEVKDLIIEKILNTKLEDIDRDGTKELVADVVMYYYTCPSF